MLHDDATGKAMLPIGTITAPALPEVVTSRVCNGAMAGWSIVLTAQRNCRSMTARVKVTYELRST